MDITAFNIEQKSFSLKTKTIYSILILIAVALTILLYKFTGRINILIYLALAAIIFSQILNFKITYIIYVITFFLNILLFNFKVAVLFSLLLLISFVVTQKFKLNEFKNPLTLAILFYLICSVPSFYYDYSLQDSLYTSLNFFAFLIVVYTTSIYFDIYKKFSLPLITFIVLSCINGFVVIIQVLLTQKRLFGFAGVMFVDFVHLAILISLAYVLYKKGFVKVLNIFIILLLSVSSVLMQTRNAWIVMIATIITFLPYILIKAPKFGLKRSKIVFSFFIFFALIAISVSVGISSKVNLSQRVGELQSKAAINESGVASNSIVTRMLIWDTAWHGIQAHPYIGIGFYSFPFNSKYYYKIPRTLYKEYVYGRTPHIGYLAVLTETGLLGLMAFLILIGSILYLIFKAANLAKEKDEIFFSQILLWCLVYITYSLFMTDAWLWGSAIMVWGMLLGLSTANYRKLINQSNEQ